MSDYSLIKDFYKNKKILITGHTGFKGSWLTLWLTELGAEVIGYSLEPPTKPSLFEVLNLKDKIIHISGDIRDEEKLKSVFKEYMDGSIITKQEFLKFFSSLKTLIE